MTESAWSDDSLRLLQERLAAPLPPPKRKRPSRAKPSLVVTHHPDPLIAAKAVAMRFRWAVATSNAVEVARIAGGMSREHLIALAVVGFEGNTPGSMRLLQVTKATDDAPGKAGAA